MQDDVLVRRRGIAPDGERVRGSSDMGTKQICGLSMRRSRSTIVAALAVAAAGCGAVADTPPPTLAVKSPPGFWPSNATDGPTPAALGEVIDVPAGFVREGYWKFSAARRTLVAGACDEANAGLRTYRLQVAPFRLMKFEVSNQVYASCVTSGACKAPDGDLADDPSGPGPWDAPSRAARPVAVSQVVARAFCRAHGGDLPTSYQWVRAAEGDAGGFGIKSLSEAWIRCQMGDSLPLCEALRRAPWELAIHEQTPGAPESSRYRPISEVGALTWDVGPYGHMGLFAGAGEWVRVPTPRNAVRIPDPCDSEKLLSDEFFEASYEALAETRVPVMQLARELSLLGDLTAPDADAVASVQHEADGRPAGRGRYFTGFRCAFPPKAP